MSKLDQLGRLGCAGVVQPSGLDGKTSSFSEDMESNGERRMDLRPTGDASSADMDANHQFTHRAGSMPSFVWGALSRRRWIVAGFLGASILMASFLQLAQRTRYRSTAKLLVRYVASGPAQDRWPRDDTVVNSELAILSSAGLARQVAELVGPGKLLEGDSGGSDGSRAAATILKNLTIEVAPRSTLLQVSFLHPDPKVAQLVLRTLIEAYLKKLSERHVSAQNVNVSIVQHATAGEARSAGFRWDVAAVLIGGLLGGVGCAVLVEFVLGTELCDSQVENRQDPS